MREISAGIIIYRKTKEGPKFLLLYHGGRYWSFPKGKIETLPKDGRGGREKPIKETSFRAAIRETAEETGLRPSDLKPKSRFKAYEKYIFFRGKQRVFKIVIFYLAETSERQVKISEEHEGFGWFRYQDAKRLLKVHKEPVALLEKAYNFIAWSPRKRFS